jgi:hypothetical protein
MSILRTISEQRRKLLDALEANGGDINLSIFEDFYPDEAHFIYELLQNAEDAGATEVSFELLPHACIVEHNGTRHFDEKDIRSITGVFSSTKKEVADKIGKFGVGFKSVFVYTDTPVVFSKNFSFRIEKLVLPVEISSKANLKDKTRFEFPFNNPKKNVKEAFAEIRNGLEQLSETTLLFLKSIESIRWSVGTMVGDVIRDEHSDVHVEILKQLDGKEVLSSHWLRFTAPVEDIGRFASPVEGVEAQNISVAFELALLTDKTTFDKKVPISKQLKIVPATRGKVSVFFPAEKESSGLRFHLHAPFVPELSRASIKNTPENVPLFEQLGKLAAASLHRIKEFGLLSGEFLSVLPHNDDVLPDRYAGIRNSIVRELQTKALVPTYSLSHAPGNQLYQSRASIKALLSDADLAFVTSTDGSCTWAITASQRNSNQDKLLSSLNLRSFEADDLRQFIEDNLIEDDEYSYRNRTIDDETSKWISTKSDEWHQALYAILYKHCDDEEEVGELRLADIVRTSDGTYKSGCEVYFQDGDSLSGGTLARVANGILSDGTRKAQQADARKFLELIGVKVPGEAEEIYQLLESRYGFTGEAPTDKQYLIDLKRFIQYAEKNSTSKVRFSQACLFKVDSLEIEWAGALSVYVDGPISKTGLKSYYEHLVVDADSKMHQLSVWYVNCGIEVKKVIWFAELVGCKTKFEGLFVKTDTSNNPQRAYLTSVPGERYTSPIDTDYAMTLVAWNILNEKDEDFSRLVWKTMCDAGAKVTRAVYQKNDSNGYYTAPSQLITLLSVVAWIPLRDGSFVKPRDVNKDDLIDGFTYDASYKWIELVGVGAADRLSKAEAAARATRRAALGFNTEDEYQQYLAFRNLPPERRKKILEESKNADRPIVELPEREVRNPELRQSRVAVEARNTAEKSSVLRTRSVQVNVEAAKAEAKLYLADQYTNSSNQTICQACKDELPFKLPSGSYYFEAVEVIHDSKKRLRESFLCLCPNHAAAYKYANGQQNSMRELVATASGTEIDVALGGEELSLYFTQVHLADLKACLSAEEEADDD